VPSRPPLVPSRPETNPELVPRVSSPGAESRYWSRQGRGKASRRRTYIAALGDSRPESHVVPHAHNFNYPRTMMVGGAARSVQSRTLLQGGLSHCFPTSQLPLKHRKTKHHARTAVEYSPPPAHRICTMSTPLRTQTTQRPGRAMQNPAPQ